MGFDDEARRARSLVHLEAEDSGRSAATGRLPGASCEPSDAKPLDAEPSGSEGAGAEGAGSRDSGWIPDGSSLSEPFISGAREIGGSGCAGGSGRDDETDTVVREDPDPAGSDPAEAPVRRAESRADDGTSETSDAPVPGESPLLRAWTAEATPATTATSTTAMTERTMIIESGIQPD